jgi:proteasome lid subunit RPN8/RPN11
MTVAAERVTLTAAVLEAIRRHGTSTYPYECCGALVGSASDDRVIEALPLPNSTEEGPRRRFLVTPQDYLRAERHCSSRGLALLGFYHSHPDHPAEPSQHDLAHAWPNLHYVIVSIRDAQPEALRSWRLAADRSRFDEVVVATAEDA